VCADPYPHHEGVVASRSCSPFNIVVSPTSYSPGDNITGGGSKTCGETRVSDREPGSKRHASAEGVFACRQSLTSSAADCTKSSDCRGDCLAHLRNQWLHACAYSVNGDLADRVYQNDYDCTLFANVTYSFMLCYFVLFCVILCYCAMFIRRRKFRTSNPDVERQPVTPPRRQRALFERECSIFLSFICILRNYYYNL